MSARLQRRSLSARHACRRNQVTQIPTHGGEETGLRSLL